MSQVGHNLFISVLLSRGLGAARRPFGDVRFAGRTDAGVITASICKTRQPETKCQLMAGT